MPGPWGVAFSYARTDPGQPLLRHLLLGMNAHINYDLPQALLAVIPPEDFENGHLMDRRRRDHERIDHVLAERVSAEDVELEKAGPTRTPLDRLVASAGNDSDYLTSRNNLLHRREELDPFALSRQIEAKLQRVYALANVRQSPRVSSNDKPRRVTF